MSATPPDERLYAAAAFVRQGAVFADIGTDHAHLPIFLLKTGRISFAVAADLREGPLSRAKKNAREADVDKCIEFRLTNGLSGMEDLPLTDIAICGMGGMLIAEILESAPFIRTPDVQLILQPMTRTAHLRRYLAQTGFAVRDERLCHAAGRFYVCLSAFYTGEPYEISALEAECGRFILNRAPDARSRAFVKERLKSAERRLDGQRKGHLADDLELTALIATYKRYLEDHQI